MGRWVCVCTLLFILLSFFCFFIFFSSQWKFFLFLFHGEKRKLNEILHSDERKGKERKAMIGIIGLTRDFFFFLTKRTGAGAGAGAR